MQPIPLPSPEIVSEESDTGSASFSKCGRYRYLLERRTPLFAEQERRVTFLMSNPSIATAFVDDPTIKRCMNFAAAWGYETLIVANLFAFRATNPAELYRCEDPIGPLNHQFIRGALLRSEFVICAWGVHGEHGNRDAAVMELLREVGTPIKCLRITKGGHPSHPLYLPGNLQPIPYAGR